jgi:GTPase
MTDESINSPPGAGPMVRCGFAALAGRPNVGKSTLLNALVGQKVSIVSPKPQTTRTRIHGVLNQPGMQIAFVDLPGIHTKQTRAIVLLINKVDRAHPKERLLPFIEELTQKADFAAVVPISATRRTTLEKLPEVIAKFLPEQPRIFPEEQVTDSPDHFMAAELIREKLMLRLQEELPYGLVVEIEGIGASEDEPGKLVVQAVIWVERAGQKAIVIGKGGSLLKEVGRQSRLDLNRHFNQPVHLELWVKVKEGWSDDENAMRKFGYES